MEESAKKIIQKLNSICAYFYIYKSSNSIQEGKELLSDIQQFGNYILEIVENNKEDKEWLQVNDFMLECINDYVSSIRNNDAVLLIDTLDFGIRKLANMFIEEDGNEDE